MRRGSESNESNDGRRTHAGGLTVRRVPNPPVRGQVLCHEVRHAGTHICFGRGDAHRTTSVPGMSCGAGTPTQGPRAAAIRTRRERSRTRAAFVPTRRHLGGLGARPNTHVPRLDRSFRARIFGWIGAESGNRHAWAVRGD